MLHETGKLFDNHYAPALPEENDFVLCFDGDRVLAALQNGSLCFPTVKEAGASRTSYYLFTLDGRRYFLGEATPFAVFSFLTPQVLRVALPRSAAFAGLTGLHLAGWYRNHRFCGRCGKEMRHSETERAMVCGCGNLVYPQICPAVIVAIVHDGRICLTKYNRPDAKWALVAGYTEVGETPEETVHREAAEETGLRVKNLRYYKSQPWGLTGSLLLGFFCEAEGDGAISVDKVELKEGRWFSPAEIDFPDDGVSLTREMIEVFRRGESPV